MAFAVRAGQSGSSLLLTQCSLERKDSAAVHQERMDCSEARLGTQTHLAAAYVPMLAQHRGLRSQVQMSSCWEGSHHGLVPACACTLIAVDSREVEVVAARHGGCMDSRHVTPRCWTTRRTAGAVILHVCACSGLSGVCAMNVVVAVALLAL